MPTNRRDFLRTTAVAVAALPVGLPRFAYPHPINAPKQPQVATTTTLSSNDDSIRPFSVNIREEALRDLRSRIAATRLPDSEVVEDASQGVQLTTIQKLMTYWGTDYDLRRVEARLNALPQFMTQIDGVDIHFIHVRSKHENALPLLITHGWPGSVIELLEVVGPLTDPTAHSGSAEDAFHVVIPSIPGYGFSGKPTTTGWTAARVSGAWVELMSRLGYTGYVAQGGDQGAVVTHALGLRAPEGLLGIHLNLLATVPPDVAPALFGLGPLPAGLPDEVRVAVGALIGAARAT